MSATASGVFGPAPPGTNLDETQNASITSAVVSLMTIGTVAVAIRAVARTIQKGITLAADDYCVMVGLIFAHGTAICSLVSLPYGGGKHLWVLSAEEFTTIWKILFAYVMIYAVAVSFTKMSIVLFYRRIFGMTWALWFCVFQIVSYLIVVLATIIFACRPLPFFWTRYTNPTAKGTCINVPQFFFANGIWAMLVDVCILLAPIHSIYKLKMPSSQKVVVSLIFLLGSFVCIASIVRIITIHTVISSADLTWAMGKLFIWSCCEPFIGIVCACLPTFAPFFRRWWAAVRTRGASDPESGSPPSYPSKDSRRMKGFSASTSGNMGSVDHKRGDGVVSSSFPMSKGKKEWSRVNDEDLRLRSDDEIELTSRITGPSSFRTKEGSDDGSDHCSKDIVVKKDVVWSSSNLDVS